MHSISPTARISALADLEESVRGSKLVIEDDVFIDAFVKIKFAGGSGDVRIGRGTYLNSGVVIYSGNGVTIGENVLVAANTTFAATNHEMARRDLPISRQGFAPSRGGIVVEDDVWIGANSVLLDGTRLAVGSVVGALSLVNGATEPYSVNVGTPAKRIGYRAAGEEANA